MLREILAYLFLITGTINFLHMVMYIVGANIYDIQAFLRKSKRGEKSSSRPLVSVLIPAYNEEKVIRRSLASVWNSTYENIEIIVIDDGSIDSTADRARQFMSQRSKPSRPTNSKIVKSKNILKRQWRRGQTPIIRRVRLISQKNAGKAAALNNGLRGYAKGELVMSLDADSILHKRAISNVIKYFDDPKVAGVAANVRIIEEMTILGMLQRFEHMIGYRSKKFYTAANCELVIGGVASTYRYSTLKKVRYYDTNTTTEDIGLSMKIAAKGNKKNKLVYAADVAAMTEGVGNIKSLLIQRYRWKLGSLQNFIKYRKILFNRDDKYTKTLSWYRMPMVIFGEIMLLMEPVVLIYLLYLSLRFLTPTLFVGGYLAITAYLLLTIWPDEHLTLAGKLKSSLLTPVIYFIFYIMNFVQLASVIRCLINFDRVIHLPKSEGNWISPSRAGKATSFS
ncbi:MAG TPA: glycosyltransferase [Candidatus Saccharimonadales bacterium]|nr:glycosyltransferase [Candidatus Saccharimonadales bacterium]